ncbi:amidohydrolase family protein [Devosia sp. A8/3-2]|nr:amidohydrolase family protein [Devosia sp. A8/3-2]
MARQSAVAHCALSNIYFANAVFPLRRALEKHLHVGLGTDISGGPSASMFEACRTTVQASRLLQDGVDPTLPAANRGTLGSAIDLKTAFHLATAGGGIALDLPIGIFAPGYRFDAVVIDTSAQTGGIRLFGGNPARSRVRENPLRHQPRQYRAGLGRWPPDRLNGLDRVDKALDESSGLFFVLARGPPQK